MDTSLLIFIPDDLLKNIYLYLSDDTKYMLTKVDYEKHYIKTINRLRKKKYNSYIRFIIRNDYSYLFDNLLKHKYTDFHKKADFNYKNVTYKYLYEFIKYYIQINKSDKCKQIIIKYAT